MQEHLDLVRSDFQFIFKDIMDLDHFDENIFFSDPISKFTFFRGRRMLMSVIIRSCECCFHVMHIRAWEGEP